MTSLIGRKMPRAEEIVVPLLRQALPSVQVTTWVPDITKRKYPILNVRRLSGLPVDPTQLDKPTLEITSYGNESLAATEDLYLDARQLLYEAVMNQTLFEAGYLHSFYETMGATTFESPYEDTWRVQGIIELGMRPPNE